MNPRPRNESEDSLALTSAGTNKACLRAQLESARQVFFELLRTLSRSDWNQRGTGTAWTAGELMSHLAADLSTLPDRIGSTQLDQAASLPRLLQQWRQFTLTRRRARRENRQLLAQRYDAACQAALHVLEQLQTDGQQGQNRSGQQRAVEHTIQQHICHFAGHVDQIQRGLARKQPRLLPATILEGA